MVTGAAIKLLLVGGKEDPSLVGQGKDLMSLELSKVGQQLQSALGTYPTIMLCLVFNSNYFRHERDKTRRESMVSSESSFELT